MQGSEGENQQSLGDPSLRQMKGHVTSLWNNRKSETFMSLFGSKKKNHNSLFSKTHFSLIFYDMVKNCGTYLRDGTKCPPFGSGCSESPLIPESREVDVRTLEKLLESLFTLPPLALLPIYLLPDGSACRSICTTVISRRLRVLPPADSGVWGVSVKGCVCVCVCVCL